MSTGQLIEDVSRELQDESRVRWTDNDLADYVNQVLYEMVRTRPDITTETKCLSLAQGTRQVIPDDAIQLLQLTRNAPDGRAIRYVSRDSLDASMIMWHARTPSSTIRDYVWRQEESDVFHVYPPAKQGAKVEAILGMRPDQVAPPDTLIDWKEGDTEAFTRRDAEQLLVGMARDLIIGLDWSTRAFVEGLFDNQGRHVIRERFRCPTYKSWDYLLEGMKGLFPNEDLTSIESLFGNIKTVFQDKVSFTDNKPVEPVDLDTYPTANPGAFNTIMNEALDGTVIQDMWDDLVANGNNTCGTSVDWTAGNLETLAKRDALGMISAIAQDIATGTTKYTRGFVENLWDDNGLPVFSEEQRCGFKVTWDFIVSAYQPLLNTTTHQAFTDLTQLIKDTVDQKPLGLIKINAPDIADQVTANRSLGENIFNNRQALIDQMWDRIVNESADDCPAQWPELPVPLYWRDTVMDGVIARALARNTDAGSIERAAYHWDRFQSALGVQRQARMSFRPSRRQPPGVRKDDDD